MIGGLRLPPIPLVSAPTGDDGTRPGNGSYTRILAAVGAKGTLASGRRIGGGGYGFNPGPGNRDYWFFGVAASAPDYRQSNPRRRVVSSNGISRRESLAASVFPSAVKPQPASTSAESMISRRIITSCSRPDVGSRTQRRAINSHITGQYNGHFEVGTKRSCRDCVYSGRAVAPRSASTQPRRTTLMPFRFPALKPGPGALLPGPGSPCAAP